MQRLWLVLLSLVFVLVLAETAFARHRQHVTIYKRPAQPVASPVPLVAVPPIAVLFDIARRTSCDPAIAVATGPNDPGFTSYPVGNYLIPAIYERCGQRPSPRRRR